MLRVWCFDELSVKLILVVANSYIGLYKTERKTHFNHSKKQNNGSQKHLYKKPSLSAEMPRFETLRSGSTATATLRRIHHRLNEKIRSPTSRFIF